MNRFCSVLTPGIAARLLAALATLSLLGSGAQAAQTPLDRADPAVIEEELPDADADRPATPALPAIGPTTSGDVAVAGTIVAGAIRVEGAEALPPSAFAPVIARYAGRLLSQTELAALAGDIANVARAAGYGLATAWIPAQRVGNHILLVRIDEGRIDAIEAQGRAATVAERYLRALVHGRPVRTRDLERQLLVAGDVAGIRVSRPKLERRNGRNILVVKTFRDRVEGRAALDNWGTDAVGPVRAQLIGAVNGAIADDDRLFAGAVVTPFEPSEFGLVRLGYAKAIGTDGTEIELSGYYAYTHPGGVLEDRDIDGHSLDGEIELSHPFVRTRAASLWGYAGFGLRESVQARRGDRIREDNLTTAWLSAFATSSSNHGYARGRVTARRGIDAFGATERGDPLASRNDAGGSFGKLDYWAEYVRYLSKRASVRIASEGQIATRPLLSSEEMGLGGRTFLRGYDYREFSGDKGIAGSVELRYDLSKTPGPVRKAQFYAYADAGSVGNYRGGGGGGSLASAGGGVRIWLGRSIEGGLELGLPLADGARGEDRDPRLSFTLLSHF